MKTVFVVTAYRWGSRSDHSYVVGVFNKKAQAIKCAESHASYRGGKYGCDVDEAQIDLYTEDIESDYTKVVYQAKSIAP